eukprot:CAMPEP_0194759942 /NCGR_PEP_ID=MMETSP0323_2-20130528/12918_1 /TAXON_ID=2866 ORGANISM="Crypthecodinium cohnii, Strain Seligo" /NCGR_SAMPLE_ID=MMETSP0323_2 /ASSEMBLY_ACC=CAM_ASM_000346 /LENGTH=111 /DNA_ID=CAMNT_0039680937 /DNA_START=195 /DNA_END=530 /DNA_ORIENTATION=-
MAMAMATVVGRLARGVALPLPLDMTLDVNWDWALALALGMALTLAGSLALALALAGNLNLNWVGGLSLNLLSLLGGMDGGCSWERERPTGLWEEWQVLADVLARLLYRGWQ